MLQKGLMNASADIQLADFMDSAAETPKETEPSLKEQEEWSQDLSVSSPSWKEVVSNSPEPSAEREVYKEQSEMGDIDDLAVMVAEELEIMDLDEGITTPNV